MASQDSIEHHAAEQNNHDDIKSHIYTKLTPTTTAGNGAFSPPDHKSPDPHFVPSTVKSTLGSPTALAIGAFATTLTTLSLSLMEFRGVTTTNVYIGNFFFVAGIGMVISAQWELVLGNSYGYTVLSAFGLFYAGFGAIITPSFGVTDAYGTDTVQYNNALGFFVLMWSVLNLFFLFGSLPTNLVYIGIFFFVEMAFVLIAGSYFATADGHASAATALKKTGGVFAFLAGLLGYYTVANLMCQVALFWHFPMGDTSRFFVKARKGSAEKDA
ncbi:hypothetical protein HYFRA_00007133 [Hymenoscyphus fraxineus]|uniref:Uncharacterized protein n=1 Tax=Hymenoscyphus fraxineus TaxID=746836 RepID=A0A9N9PU13_9HELO|nr:hypothetical protein HYFRA_00007133 [Hymenoscyphus fraxineus]